MSRRDAPDADLIAPDGTVTHPDRETLEAANATHDRLASYVPDDTDRRLFAAGRKPAGSTEFEARTGGGVTVDRDALLDLIQAYGAACEKDGAWARSTDRDELGAARMLSYRRILDVLYPGWRKSGPASAEGSYPTDDQPGLPETNPDGSNLRDDGAEVEDDLERARRIL